MKKEILKQLKSDYEELEIKPSADLWGRIEQIGREEEKSISMGSKKAFQGWKYAAVLVVLVSVGVLLYFSRNHPVRTDNPVVHAKLPEEHIKTSITSPEISAVENKKAENTTNRESMKAVPDIPHLLIHYNHRQFLHLRKEHFYSSG